MTRADLPAVPYPGIEPFAYAERKVFFARASEARRLIRLITLYRGVLLFAASGVGKSSLVNAGVIPLAIEEGHRPERLRVQPRRNEEVLVEPIPGLRSILADGGEPAVLSIESFLERVRTRAAEARPLLIFDQFEEWVTLFEDESACRERVLDALCSLIADGQLPVKILIVLREDYLANLQPLFERCPNLSDHYLRLTALGAKELHSTIRGPFEAHPGVYEPEIEPGLASQIIEQLTARADGNGVPLTEVQIVCRKLFETGQQGKDSVRLFKELGVQGILERYLEGALDALGPKLRNPAVALLSRMITSAGTRNVISRDDLVERVALEDGISRARLGTALDDLETKTHLVRKEMRREVHFYEIVSEFLVDWIRRQAERLKADRDSRRLRRLAIISGTAGLVLVGMLFFMWLSWREADRQRQLRTSQLVADVSGETKESAKALLLAVESVRRAHKVGVEPFAEAVENLRRALANSPGHALGSYGKPVFSAAMSPDGRWLAGAGKGDVLYLWRATPEALKTDPIELPGHEGPVETVAVSLDGHWLAVSDGRTIALRKLAPREDHPRLLTAPDDLENLLFSANGEWLVAAGKDQVPRIWSLRGELAGQGRPLALCRATRWSGSASLRWIAVGCEDGLTELWDLNGVSSKGTRLPRYSDAEIWALAFSRQEDLLATGSIDGSVRLWNLDRPGSFSDEPTGETAEVLALAFHPHGSQLAIGRDDGTVGLWRFDGARIFSGKRPPAVWSPGSRLTWSADGDWLLVRGPKEDYRLWTMSFSDSLIPARDFDSFLRTAATAALSPDSRWLVAGTADSLAYEALIESSSSRRSVRVGEGPVERLDFGRGVCLTQTSKGLARLWNMGDESWADGDEPRVSHSQGLIEVLENSTASPGGAWRLDVSSDVPIVQGRESSDSLVRHEGGVTAWEFSGNGHWLVTGDRRGNARLWSLPSEMIQSIQHPRPVTFARFSSNSLLLITLGGTAVLWRSDTFPLSPVQRLDGHAGEVTAAGFSADSRWLATADNRGRVLLWDLSREPLQATELPGPSELGAITHVEVDPAARKVFADDDRGNRWEWRMDLDELIDLACRTVGRNLLPGEWNPYIDGYDGKTCPDFPGRAR